MEPASVVRHGYTVIADRYLALRRTHGDDVRLVRDLERLLPRKAKVLDVGCGAGIPITRRLSRSFEVLGVDFAPAQIARARANVPGARFLYADMTALALPSASFDAICCFYALIHVPRRLHARTLRNFARMLRPSGLLLVCLGAEDLPAQYEEDYLGAPMYWSHFDAATNLRLVRQAGLHVVWSRLVRDATDERSRHLFVLARRGRGSQRTRAGKQ
jgi:SAM-dependent methyltransferase